MREVEFNRHGGGKPEGKEGVFSFPCQRTSAYFTLSEYDVNFEQASPNTPNTSSEILIGCKKPTA